MREQAQPAVSNAELRNHELAPAIRRGALRLLNALGFAAVAELPLGSGRRADLVALGDGGEIWIARSSPALPIFAPTGNGRNTGFIATGCCSPSRRIFPRRPCPLTRVS